MALSLLRCVNNWICAGSEGSDYPSQKGGQCFGKHSVRYAIVPHKGYWQNADIPLLAELFNVSAVPVQTNRHKGSLPAGQSSLFEISNKSLRFSALKKTEDRDTCLVRIYNPTDEVQNGMIKFAADISKAWTTNLNEDREKEISLSGKHEIPVTVLPQKIASIEFEVKF